MSLCKFYKCLTHIFDLLIIGEISLWLSLTFRITTFCFNLFCSNTQTVNFNTITVQLQNSNNIIYISTFHIEQDLKQFLSSYIIVIISMIILLFHLNLLYVSVTMSWLLSLHFCGYLFVVIFCHQGSIRNFIFSLIHKENTRF